METPLSLSTRPISISEGDCHSIDPRAPEPSGDANVFKIEIAGWLARGGRPGSEELIEGLERAKNAFNSYPLDRLAIAGAIEAIRDDTYFQATCKKVIDTREYTVAALSKMGFSILPSMANFIFIKPAGVPARELYSRLKADKILVRYFDKPRINNYLRVTIGTDAEMQSFIEKTAQILRAV